MIKQKKCFGQGLAKGHGCGKLTSIENRVYGLGKMCGCYSDWLLNSENGKIKMQKSIFKVQKPRIAEGKAKDKTTKISLMSNDEYRKTYIQPVINKIARLIDYGQPCIATKRFGKMAGGHFFSVGSNRTTAYNLHNIHIQNFESNGMSGGDPLLYIEGLKEIYGNDYFEFVSSLKKTPDLKLNKSEMIQIYARAKTIALRLEKSVNELNPEQRIKLRNECNAELNIYEENFCVFKY